MLLTGGEGRCTLGKELLVCKWPITGLAARLSDRRSVCVSPGKSVDSPASAAAQYARTASSLRQRYRSRFGPICFASLTCIKANTRTNRRLLCRPTAWQHAVIHQNATGHNDGSAVPSQAAAISVCPQLAITYPAQALFRPAGTVSLTPCCAVLGKAILPDLAC